MGFMNKAERYLALVELIIEISKNIDISKIQARYNFTQGRKTKIHVIDADKNFMFQLVNGKLKTVWMGKPDVEIVIEKLCFFKHIRHGYIGVKNINTGEKKPMEYTPMTAWQFNHIRAFGNASTNDVVGTVDVLQEVMKSIPEDKMDEIVGECCHDVPSMKAGVKHE